MDSESRAFEAAAYGQPGSCRHALALPPAMMVPQNLAPMDPGPRCSAACLHGAGLPVPALRRQPALIDRSRA